jgi:hypothetical protein
MTAFRYSPRRGLQEGLMRRRIMLQNYWLETRPAETRRLQGSENGVSAPGHTSTRYEKTPKTRGFFVVSAKPQETLEGAGGAEGNRTPDLYNAIVALSQLSYGPEIPVPGATRVLRRATILGCSAKASEFWRMEPEYAAQGRPIVNRRRSPSSQLPARRHRHHRRR